MKKCLLIIPPYMIAARPYLSVPLLAGQLKHAGYGVSCLDLNAEFFNYILSSAFIKKINSKIKWRKTNNIYRTEAHKEKLEKISDERMLFVEKYIDTSISVYKSNDFYNSKLLFNAMKVVSAAFNIISAEIYPRRISFFEAWSAFSHLDITEINDFVNEKETNIFTEYYQLNLNKLIKDEYDLILITVPFVQNLFPTFTLSKILKEKYKAKICIGGSSITRCADEYKKNSEVFSKYCDFFSVGDGENAVVKLMKFLDGQISFEEVPGLIGINQQQKIVSNTPEYIKSFKNVSMPCFDGIDFKQYLAPEIVIPILSSKGCYWGKCTFCGFSYGTKYFGEMPIEDLVRMIKVMQSEYNINNYEFVDESVRPSYLNLFADELRKQNVKIKYGALVRTEKEFTPELLQKLYKSGCVMLNWGYESHSPRIIKLMNKGVLNIDRLSILKNSAEAGIWNHVFFLFGFPTETEEEWNMTENFIRKNIDYIDSFGTDIFRIDKHSIVYKHADKFGIKKSWKDGNLATYLTDPDAEQNEIKNRKIEKIWSDMYAEKGYRLWNILFDVYLFLYLTRYSRQSTKNTVLIRS